MYNLCDLNVSLSSLAILHMDRKNYYLDGKEPSDFFRLEPHLEIDAYYHNIPIETVESYSIKIDNQQVTLSEMLHKCHTELLPVVNNYQCLLISNSFSDRQPEIQPLPRILEWSDKKPKNYFGVSHLGSLASIDCLEILELCLNEGEEGILLLGEQLFIEQNRYRTGYLPLSDFAMGMHFSKGHGSIQILQIGNYPLAEYQSNIESSKIHFSNIIKQIYELVSHQHQPKWVIVQNLFGRMDFLESDLFFIRKTNVAQNYQSSDVWYTFTELLLSGKLKKEEKILIISANRDLSTSFAVLQFNGMPLVSSFKW
ncbi:hypothetical protein BK130_06845 [Viridibacillus sp. FSL H8-0123]|uniref:Uncharacterized protein n=2 Tax=Caryophanaceae TaxID=186818 RepID=W4F323_9BACL|nr:hypothetical protein C176_09252 [Viridibacillus arenosi FSL R5-213]OMC83159.1 hypothetical protein BK128_18745 [Viridibacillus sp. FSL H7-0596]OMC83261.1 hypothetical protein BK130_06845 [Viridibacillus sp. FSL H8-0123]OMC88172.1 hypothetical protein BK137_19085 [Viridibacillus arenosi]